MSGSQFNIPAAVRNAYAFLGREWRYLLRRGLLAVGVTLITDLLVYRQGSDITIDSLPAWNVPFQLFLWNLPSNILFGWFMFEEVRLLLLGERAKSLPEDKGFLAGRRRSLQASVMVWLLFDMAQTAVGSAIYWGFERIKQNPASSAGFIIFFMAGVAFWGIRFGILHILAAVDYPMKAFIFRVNGLGISLRLFGMTILCIIPVFLIMQGLHDLLEPESIALKDAPVPPELTRVMITASSLLNCFSQVLLTAASTFALKDMLGRPGREKTA